MKVITSCEVFQNKTRNKKTKQIKRSKKVNIDHHGVPKVDSFSRRITHRSVCRGGGFSFVLVLRKFREHLNVWTESFGTLVLQITSCQNPSMTHINDLNNSRNRIKHTSFKCSFVPFQSNFQENQFLEEIPQLTLSDFQGRVLDNPNINKGSWDYCSPQFCLKKNQIRSAKLLLRKRWLVVFVSWCHKMQVSVMY